MDAEKRVGGLVTLLSLPEIAAWQVEVPAPWRPRSAVRVALPALQRGAVWKHAQIEILWDSIERGFPVGTFLMMPYDAKLRQQKLRFADRLPTRPTHMLLDGQQRANAVALGFYSPWTVASSDAPSALWIDLGAMGAGDSESWFWVTTRAHPWGYPRSDKQRLEAKEIRAAMAAFAKAGWHAEPGAKPPVSAGWPWQARLPVPLVAVLGAKAPTPKEILRSLNQHLPHWKCIEIPEGRLEDHIERALLANERRLVRLWTAVRHYQIPAQMVDLDFDQASAPTDAPDPAETLFVRVNSGGTPLQGEDLMYSIIKAIWPASADLIARLEPRFVSEARAAFLIARLALVADSDGEMPNPPEIARFRRLVHARGKGGFRARLAEYLQGRAPPLFMDAHRLLTEGDYGLPPVLAADLARGEEGRDVMLLLLRWLERLRAARIPLESLTALQRRRAVGAITCIRWFAHRPDRAAAALWKELGKCEDSGLPGFFNRKSMASTFRAVKNQIPMTPLPPVNLLKHQVVTRTQPRGKRDSLTNAKAPVWREWNWYEQYAGSVATRLARWYRAALPMRQVAPDTDAETIDRAATEWEFLALRLWEERRLVLYAQRHALAEWFPRFDPTDPETVEETNRPWDMDHIHPRYYLEKRRSIPSLLKNWHGCIGNLRAWPFDENRSHGEQAPREKFADDEDTAVVSRYQLTRSDDKLRASFISSAEWKLWKGCTPDLDRFPPAYLAQSRAPYHACRVALVKAITSRMLALYSEWYERLAIASLMPRGRE